MPKPAFPSHWCGFPVVLFYLGVVMEKLLEAIKWLVQFGPEIISGIIAVLSGVIAIALIIPGEQPEKALKGVVAFLEKFSAKKGE